MKNIIDVSPAKSSKKVVVKRNAKGQLLPGYTPNPFGKPKGVRHMNTLLREAIVKIYEGDAEPADKLIVKKLIQMAIRGNMHAISFIWDYIDGKAPQTFVLENTDVLTEEQKVKLDMLLGENKSTTSIN